MKKDKAKGFSIKKKTFLITAAVVVVAGTGLVLSPWQGPDISDHASGDKKEDPLTMAELKNKNSFNKTAEAAVGLPWQFGGTVTFYQPLCTVDNQSGTCPSSCPMCTKMLGQACNGYQEIQYKPALGSMPSSPPGTVCAPKGFQFLGGIPRSGSQILGGGASPQLPWVIGVSS
ncbi:MAG: hypothetical protein ACOCVY_03315, partial [Patescibacteria group bacterium]